MYYSAKSHHGIVCNKNTDTITDCSYRLNKQPSFLGKAAEIILKQSDSELIFTDNNFNIVLKNCYFNFRYDNLNFFSFIRKHFSDSVSKKLSKFRTNKEKNLKIADLYHNKKENMFLEISVSKIFDETKHCEGFFICIKDISTEKLRQVQCETFISTLTHDIKTPVIAQINALKFLAKQKEDEILKEIIHSAYFMNYIIDNLLLMCKRNCNDSVCPSVYCDFGLILSSVADKFKDILARKNLSVSVHRKTEKLNEISAVKHEMEMLVINLLLNAISNSINSNKIIVTLDNWKNGIKLCIEDFGHCGSFKEDINSVFGDFISSGDKYQKHARSLFLKTSIQIVKTYGGEIKFTAAPNNIGTAVTVILPVN